MRTLGIVVGDPIRNLRAGMIEAEEQAFVEKLVAHPAVEAFTEAVLRWFSRRNEAPGDLADCAAASPALTTRAPILVETRPNARWSLDFVHDQFANGRRFRILNIVDDVTRECLAAIPDTSIPGRRVARELTVLIDRRGKPGMIVLDNGTEFTCHAELVGGQAPQALRLSPVVRAATSIWRAVRTLRPFS
jgi:hypothetical protein